MLTIRFVWRKFRDECDSLLLQGIRLSNYKDLRRADRLVERILDAEGSIAGHVRLHHWTIQNRELLPLWDFNEAGINHLCFLEIVSHSGTRSFAAYGS